MYKCICKIYIYIYIHTKYIKITAFQTRLVEVTKFHISSFKQQISGRNYCKFQAETRLKISK